jgi:hypothetical protein
MNYRGYSSDGDRIILIKGEILTCQERSFLLRHVTDAFKPMSHDPEKYLTNSRGSGCLGGPPIFNKCPLEDNKIWLLFFVFAPAL